jgi:hypothetical protein
LIVMLNTSFDRLPGAVKGVHVAALCAVALCVILLMTPATLHRLAFGGEASERFWRIGSGLVVAAAVPLALAVSADLYVACFVATASPGASLALSLVTAALLFGFWFGLPLWLRPQRP